MPDFSELEAGPARKAAFLDFLTPLVREENAAVLADRSRIESLQTAYAAEGKLGWRDELWLDRLALTYRVKVDDGEYDMAFRALLVRVDQVPASLALAQAAKESGWGSSRFARMGFNLYGQRCFTAGCGMTAHGNANEVAWEVQSFDSPGDSISSYVRNINSHERYQTLRELRSALRDRGDPIDGLTLAEGLGGYSERGPAYVEDIRTIMRVNRLEELDAAKN